MAKTSPFRGYSKLAEFIGYNPGTAIVRRFAQLNAKLLLYKEAELCRLEQDLQGLEAAEAQIKQDGGQEIMSAVDLMMQEESHKLKAKITELGQKLQEYNELLFQNAKLYKLPKPNEYDLWTLREWLKSDNYGDDFLIGLEKDIWDAEGNGRDLIALSSRGQDGDRFTRWMAECIAPFLSSLCRRSRHKQVRDDEEEQALDDQIDEKLGVYEGKRVAQVAAFISVIFASLLPTASIFALNAITGPYPRLAFIMVFSAIFSACLVIFTQARRIEIFTAAVALASVQVVFIGTN